MCTCITSRHLVQGCICHSRMLIGDASRSFQSFQGRLRYLRMQQQRINYRTEREPTTSTKLPDFHSVYWSPMQRGTLKITQHCQNYKQGGWSVLVLGDTWVPSSNSGELWIPRHVAKWMSCAADEETGPRWCCGHANWLVVVADYWRRLASSNSRVRPGRRCESSGSFRARIRTMMRSTMTIARAILLASSNCFLHLCWHCVEPAIFFVEKE